MTRGKYAAKAANRLAQLDNELLQEKLAEIESFKQQLRTCETTLRDERAVRDALVLKRSGDLSGQLIAKAKAEAVDAIAANRRGCEGAAKWICEFIRDNLDIDVPQELEDVLHDLVGNDIGEYLCIVFDAVEPGTRRFRRRRARSMQHAREHSGVNEFDRRLTLLEATSAAQDSSDIADALGNEYFHRKSQKREGLT